MPDVPNLDLSQGALQRYLSGVPAEAAPAPAQPTGLTKAWWAAVIGAQLADGLTTNAALKRPGTMEGNPAMQGLASNPTALLLSKLGIGAGLAGLAHAIHKKNPKTGKILAGVSTAVPAIAAVSNSQVGR